MAVPSCKRCCCFDDEYWAWFAPLTKYLIKKKKIHVIILQILPPSKLSTLFEYIIFFLEEELVATPLIPLLRYPVPDLNSYTGYIPLPTGDFLWLLISLLPLWCYWRNAWWYWWWCWFWCVFVLIYPTK